MERISIRVPRALRKQLELSASDAGKNLSDYIREVLAQHSLVTTDNRWKIVLWSLLGVNVVKANNALRKATSVEEFFAFVANHMMSEVEVRPALPGEDINLDFKIKDQVYNIQQKKRHPLEDAVAEVVETLEKKIMEEYNE